MSFSWKKHSQFLTTKIEPANRNNWLFQLVFLKKLPPKKPSSTLSLNKAFYIIAYCLLVSACSKTIEVQTPLGAVEGKIENSTDYFLGVPYAQPPTGDNRFRAPQLLSPWEGTLQATKNKPGCAQLSIASSVFVHGEDCLYLNITKPHSESDNPSLRPVVVWLHGGNFVIGSGSEAQYDPTVLSHFSDVIVVSVNYRLGFLGDLALPELSQEATYNASGNYYLLDQNLALQWVQQNIESFGGDPANVTLMGESAGAGSACWQLASPLSHGLFHRAIMQSGSCAWDVEPLATSEQRGREFAIAAGCETDTLACLRSKKYDELLQVSKNLYGAVSPVTGPIPLRKPALDNHFFTERPLDALSSGAASTVPVLTGINLNEGTVFTTFDYPPSNAEEYAETLESRYGDNADLVSTQYPLENYRNPATAVAEIKGDSRFVCLALNTVEALDTGGHDVYFYHFTHPPQGILKSILSLWSAKGTRAGVYHGAEVPYVFGSDSIMGYLSGEGIGLSADMMTYWKAFIYHGSPNATGLAEDQTLTFWPKYTNETEEYLELKIAPQAQTKLKEAICDFWNGIE